MQIRKYQDSRSEREQVVSLWNTIFAYGTPRNEPNFILDSKLKADDLIFVAEEEGKILGTCMAGYDGHRGWLYSVAVLFEFRRSGIGKALVESAMKELKALGCAKVNLQIRSTNQVVVKFYESLGFEVEERISMGFVLKKE